MIVCISCKKEMKCIHIGATCRWNNGTHVYNGDEYKCNNCGNRIVLCNSTPTYDSDPKIRENDYLMDKYTTNLRK